jgi:uridine kinase
MTTQSTHRQRIELQCRRMIDHPVHLEIVFLHGAGKTRPDGVETILVEGEPRRLEADDCLIALTECWRSVSHGAKPYRWGRAIQGPPTNVASMPAASRPFLIGVAGGTCAGKTMVCERLAAMAGTDHVALIRLDSYQVDHTLQSPAERAATNYDHPDAYDWALLNDHLARLVDGESVMAPTYDFTVHNRSSAVRNVQPAPVIVVEGILVLHDPALRERFDLKVYVDTDADLRFIRRLRRDVEERGRTPDSISEQYLATVRPGHEHFIEPSKRYADVIFPCGGLNEPAIQLLLARVHELTRPT